MFCQEGKIKEKQIFSKKQLFRDNALQSIQRQQVRLPQTVREHCSPLILCCGSQRQQTRNKVPGDAASAHRERRRISLHERPELQRRDFHLRQPAYAKDCGKCRISAATYFHALPTQYSISAILRKRTTAFSLYRPDNPAFNQ